jgi:phage shock protein C
MQKKLYRSRKDKLLGGVCGGLGTYFEFDPVLIRVVFVAATFITGVGLIAYILLWIIVPFEPVGPIITPDPQSPGIQDNPPMYTQQTVVQRNKGGAIFGLILIIIGCIFLADNFLPFFHFWHFWPVIFIAIGAGLLLKAPRN